MRRSTRTRLCLLLLGWPLPLKAYTVPPLHCHSRTRLQSLFDASTSEPLTSKSTTNGESDKAEIPSLAKRPLDDRLFQEFEKDVTRVLHEIRPWEFDPTLPIWFRSRQPRQLSFTNYWGLEEWERHSSRFRFIRIFFGLPLSRLLRRLWPQMTVLFFWSLFLVTRKGVVVRLKMPMASLSLVSTFIALLQTLRSNQGLSRLADARIAMGRMVQLTRDTAQLVATYLVPLDAELAMRAARHLSLMGWSLKSHFRQVDSRDVVQALLSPVDAHYICGERKRPVAIISRLRQILQYASTQLDMNKIEHRLIEDNLRNLNDVITVGERIRATPVPPVYNAHATRLMMVYLGTLPMSLLGSGMGPTASLVVTLTVGYAMLGLDEMSHMFEQPFRFMPLYQLAKVSMLDVADAFCRRPPDLDSTDVTPRPKPSYWAKEGQHPRLPYDGGTLY